jgi:two-component system OmpR family response regulator
LIRRAAGQAAPVLRCGELALDTRSGRVTLGGQAVTLTSHEFKVLDYLMHRPGAVVSRTELIEHIYAQDFDRDSNTIEVFVGRLRKKLPPGLIETVRGQGYRLAMA